ncbi:MAG: GNAT family N-acetyltransferase [Rubinisphaera brasiliensis]|uniref:GNAT family N-acetyltransferase n=1 Tax=Rubinisphaera brasiliensis TaxID=119 RepID=UPI00391C00E9
MSERNGEIFRTAVEPHTAERVNSLTPLLRLAFPGPFEAEVVEQMKQDDCRQMSAVLLREPAEAEPEVIGQAYYCALEVEQSPTEEGYSLGPMAIHPDWQGRGLGLQLLKDSLKILTDEYKAGWVAVLGEPAFYSKAGFAPASEFGLKCHYPVSPKYFMALELRPNALNDVSGYVRYHSAFGDPEDIPVEPE